MIDARAWTPSALRLRWIREIARAGGIPDADADASAMGADVLAFRQALEGARVVVCGLARHLLDPVDPDPEDPLWTLLPPDAVGIALAGARGAPWRADEIRSALSSAPCLAVLEETVSASLEAASRALPPGRPREACATLLGETRGAWASLHSYLVVWGMMASPLTCRWDPLSEAREALEDARVWLREAAPWRDAWEIRRRGLGSDPEPLVASFFGRGFVLRLLRELGEPVAPRIRALLLEAPEELRWFGAWKGIPPDADSLALALELAVGLEDPPLQQVTEPVPRRGCGVRGPVAESSFARSKLRFVATPSLPARRSRRFCRLLLEKIEAWLEPMLSSLDPEGLPGTWFARSRGGPTLDAEAPGWLGGSCVAVRLALLRALLAWDAVRFAGLAVTLAEAVQRAWEGDASHGAFFYGEAWTAELLLSTRHASLARAQEACTTEILARQQPDGSFGTPLETALMLRALASRLEALDRRRALRALCEARLPDGSWPEEPIYRMPGVSQGFGERWLRSRSMVTALCATAVQTTFEAETSEAFRRATG